MVIINLRNNPPQERRLQVNKGDLNGYIDNLCDAAFVANRDKSNCMVLRTPNEVPCQEVTGITVLRSKL